MKVLGITSGVGSLQYGFRKQGFEVVMSHEWRKYYNINKTFERNYEQPCLENYEMQRQFKGIDCIVSHPECGNYSNLYTGKNKGAREQDPGDIFKFIELCNLYQPKTFICDNLPKSLLAVDKLDWQIGFPDYDIYFEFISNWGYGNVQKNRDRLFIIGVHKDFGFVFKPQEKKHDTTIDDVISGIKKKVPNHRRMTLDEPMFFKRYNIGLKGEGRATLEQFNRWFKKMGKFNNSIPYYNLSGEVKSKVGFYVMKTDQHSLVLHGAAGQDTHYIQDPVDKYIRPLTIRERARIQGFDDDFIFYPLDFEFNSTEYASLIRQTGKCMPTQFPTEFARQLKNFINNGTIEETESRLLKQI